MMKHIPAVLVFFGLVIIAGVGISALLDRQHAKYVSTIGVAVPLRSAVASPPDACGCARDAKLVDEAALYSMPDATMYYGAEDTLDEVSAHRQHLLGLRKWATGLKNPCVRAAYLKWIDYYSGTLEYAERKIVSGEEERDREASEQERVAGELRRREFIDKCNFPKPKGAR